MEDCYQGQWNCHIMADYSWPLKQNHLDANHKHKSLKSKFVAEYII